MSAYINFYIKADDKIIPIGSFSRNSILFGATVSYIQYNDVALVNGDLIDKIRFKLDELKHGAENLLADYDSEVNAIKSFNNSVADKMEYIRELEDSRRDATENLREIEYAENYLNFIDNICDESDMMYKYEVHLPYLKNGAVVYVGYECDIEKIKALKGEE